MARFGRVSTAMVTPFDAFGQIDFEKVTNLVNTLIKNGSDSLVVCGTTGESPTLSKSEKLELIKHVVLIANGRIPVIAGTGSNNTLETVEFTKTVSMLGVDAVMVVVPYYNKPSQEGLYQHFKLVAESTSLPVMLYNVPGRTVANLAVETTVRLASIPNIIAIKDATGDLGVMVEIIEKTPDDFELYCGDDGLTLPALSIGAKGVVSVASHVVGEEMQKLIGSFLSGDVKTAQTIHQKLYPIFTGLFMAPSPSPVKAALNIKGIDVGSVRLPLVPLSESETSKVKGLLDRVETSLKTR